MSEWIVLVEWFMGVAVIVLLLWPLVRQAGIPVNSVESERSVTPVLRGLSELEYDYKTGKMSREDYEELKGQFLREASEQLTDQEIERLSNRMSQEDVSPPPAEDLEVAIQEARKKID